MNRSKNLLDNDDTSHVNNHPVSLYNSNCQDSVPAAALVGGNPLELLAWNSSFFEIFSDTIRPHNGNDHKSQKELLLSEISKILGQDLDEEKSDIIVCNLPTPAGIKRFEMAKKMMGSGDQSVRLITLKPQSIPVNEKSKVTLPAMDYKSLFWNAPVMMMQMDIDGTLQNVNQRWLRFTGYSLDEIFGNSFGMCLSEQSRETLINEVLPAIGNSVTSIDIPFVLVTKEGEQKHVSITLSRPEIAANSNAIIGVIQEHPGPSHIEKENTLANALRETAAALTSTLNFDEVLDQILISVGRVVPNEAANVMMIFSGIAYIVRSTGYAERGLEDAVMSLQLPVTQDPHLLSMYETGMPLAVKDIREYAGIQHYAGTDWPSSVASAPLRSKGQVFGFLNLESSEAGFYSQKHADRLQAFADQAAVAIENARLYAEVQQYAITDELTTLYNRRGLYELGKREVERAHRYNRSLSAIMIDVDKFKMTNDNYSHAVGDQVLRVLSDRIRSCIREVDIPGRYGGDEFVILLPETELASAVQVAERLRQSVCETAMQTSAGDIPLTISVGVAELSDEKNTFDILLENADSAMFAAKDRGKNQVAS